MSGTPLTVRGREAAPKVKPATVGQLLWCCTPGRGSIQPAEVLAVEGDRLRVRGAGSSFDGREWTLPAAHCDRNMALLYDRLRREAAP